MSRPLHVLVVDDSAVVRQTIMAILRREGFEVTTAADPLIAAERLANIDPDVMLLDLEMPRMDGLSFLRKIMAERPMPVVICSALAARGTENAVRALEEGAVDIVAKPQYAVRDFLNESAVMLTDTIRAAAAARLLLKRRHAPTPRGGADASSAPRRPADEASAAPNMVIAIGASTGGTDALRSIISELQPGAPPIVVVQHMPAKFTAVFARSLDASSRLHVREAADGDIVTAGTVLIAPGDRHMRITPHLHGYRASLADGPLVSRHRPSVDVLFRSVATAAQHNALGILLTGMGADGADGLMAMRLAGAPTIAQDEESCVVFGMPKEAIRRGAAESVLPLSAMAEAIQTAGRVSAARHSRGVVYEAQR
ncbi:MAG TPA: chemotaxis response regulator protein-glutamate methylesterase [Thermoanaerobaculia bacterium]|nr:chemotaxis response regulator protein-glutamate methylesterase [Thermoanaerobaculia bacterium]